MEIRINLFHIGKGSRLWLRFCPGCFQINPALVRKWLRLIQFRTRSGDNKKWSNHIAFCCLPSWPSSNLAMVIPLSKTIRNKIRFLIFFFRGSKITNEMLFWEQWGKSNSQSKNSICNRDIPYPLVRNIYICAKIVGWWSGRHGG